MLQLVPPSQSPAIAADMGEVATGDGFLDFAGPVAGSHALVIAPNGLDLLCRLLRRGCAAAMVMRLAERPEHEAYDLVLAPQVTTATEIGRLVFQVKRALTPTGRFLAFVPSLPAVREQDVAGLLVRSVRLGGFVSVQTGAVEDGLLVRADLPMAGMSCMPPRLIRHHA